MPGIGEGRGKDSPASFIGKRGANQSWSQEFGDPRTSCGGNTYGFGEMESTDFERPCFLQTGAGLLGPQGLGNKTRI